MYDINHSMIFHDLPPKITEKKPKINKWYLIKLIRFFHSKGIYKQSENPQDGTK